jgi:hypothetical protein
MASISSASMRRVPRLTKLQQADANYARPTSTLNASCMNEISCPSCAQAGRKGLMYGPQGGCRGGAPLSRWVAQEDARRVKAKMKKFS